MKTLGQILGLVSNMQSYFDEEGQSVFLEGKEAEHVVLSTLSERHQVSKAVSKYRLSLQHLCVGYII